MELMYDFIEHNFETSLPQIIFLSCQAHRLNTLLEHSCHTSSNIGYAIDMLENLYVFFFLQVIKIYYLLNEKCPKLTMHYH